MSKNELSDDLINHYFAPKKGKRAPVKSIFSTKKSGQNLKDFYNEVKNQNSNYAIHNVYNGKSAVEIEQMMMKNRKLIEANYTKC